MSIDRSEVSRALAKAIAYKSCGKDKEANEWAKKLIILLECAEGEGKTMIIDKLIEKSETMKNQTGLSLCENFGIFYSGVNGKYEEHHHCSPSRILSIVKSDSKKIEGPFTVEIRLENDIREIKTVSHRFPGYKNGTMVFRGHK